MLGDVGDCSADKIIAVIRMELLKSEQRQHAGKDDHQVGLMQNIVLVTAFVQLESLQSIIDIGMHIFCLYDRIFRNQRGACLHIWSGHGGETEQVLSSAGFIAVMLIVVDLFGEDDGYVTFFHVVQLCADTTDQRPFKYICELNVLVKMRRNVCAVDIVKLKIVFLFIKQGINSLILYFEIFIAVLSRMLPGAGPDVRSMRRMYCCALVMHINQVTIIINVSGMACKHFLTKKVKNSSIFG